MLSLFAAAVLTAQSPTSCSPATSLRTTVAEIGEHLDRFLDKCVTVAGPFTGIAIFGSVEDMYLTARYGPDGNYNRSALKRGRLGLDSPESELRSLKLEGIPRIEVTGTVDSCERRAAKARARQKEENARKSGSEITIFMLTGYCHYYGGAVLNGVSWAFDPSTRYRRFVGERAREKFGNLVQMDEDWPFARDLRAASTEFFNALRAGDRAELIKLHDFNNSRMEFSGRVIEALLDRSNSPFVQIRANPAPQTRIFLDRYEVEQMELGKPPKFAVGVACFCRSKDCTHRWPISYGDTDNSDTRPYACVRIRREQFQTGSKLALDTQPGGRWLDEPPAAAFHPN